MRSARLFALALPLAVACSASSASTAGASPTSGEAGTGGATDGDDVTMTSEKLTLQPGEEVFKCQNFTLADDVVVKEFNSAMTPGSHHLIIFTAPDSTQPDGVVYDCPSGVGPASGASSTPVWTYGSQQPEEVLTMPDGVGVVLKAKQRVIFNMHYINAGAASLEAHVTFGLRTHAPGATFTPAAAFRTYNTKIDIPPSGTQTVDGACAVPDGAKFFALTTHSHQFTTSATISDGTTTIVNTTDWNHPPIVTFAAPFFEFASHKLSYQCSYMNPTDTAITVGFM
jgi:hypothetical protein